MEQRVVNSVQQITKEANRLIDIAGDYSVMDISIAAMLLQNAVNELNEVFDKEPGNEAKIRDLKCTAEIKGLNLEYFLALRNPEVSESYKLRSYIELIYDNISSIFMQVSRDENSGKAEIAELASLTSAMLKLKLRSKHLIFVLDDEDNELIKNVVGTINRREGKE